MADPLKLGLQVVAAPTEAEAGLKPARAEGSVARHSTLNFIGSAVPIIIGFVTVPLYLRLIGPERFGVLSIAWLLLGYFGLFDLGLGAATSFRIAALRDASRAERARTFWTALVVNLGLGVIGAAALWIAGDVFFGRIFKVDPVLRLEVLRGVPYLAAAVPIATLTGVLYGSLQARQRFLSTNLVSILSTILFQVAPIVVASVYGPYLPSLLATAILARCIPVLVMMIMCYAELIRGQRPRIDLAEVKALLGYGAWVTLAAISGPVLAFSDRFAIGAILGAVAVATYTIPFQLASRIIILPSALTTALFPRFVPASQEDRVRVGQITTMTIASLLTLPVVVAIVVLRPFLDIWIGAAMAAKAAPVGRILLVGFWLNAFAYVPQMQLQSSGRPRVVALILVLQIVPYLAALYVGLSWFGLTGCAVVFCLRNAADWALLGWGAGSAFKGWPLLLLDLGLLGAAVLLTGAPVVGVAEYAGLAVVALVVLAVSWQTLPGDSRRLLLSRLRRLREATSNA